LLATEATRSLIERLLVAALWGLKRFERYTAFSASVVVVLPHPAEVATVKKSQLPLRIQSVLIELSSFQCSYESGEGAWMLQGRLA
jgi:hypothetical protein